MRISKIFNEQRIIALPVYNLFKLYHFFRKKLGTHNGFTLLGDKPGSIYVPFHPIPENNLYGHVEVFRRYMGNSNKFINAQIQHGVIFGTLIQETTYKSFAPTIITYSNKRKKLIEAQTGKRAIAVGPYIKYVNKRLTNDEFRLMKAKFGKILMVFPTHSAVNRTTVSFDLKDLIGRINEIKQDHDIKTVFINLYYSNCSEEAIGFYRSQGFEVCSAGYWLSENFLPNLRTLIELADLTMSNSVGTHVGYCLSLNRPHYIYKQDYKHSFVDGKRKMGELEQFNKNIDLVQHDINKIEREFLNDDFIISKEQQDIVNEYWGNNILLTPRELNNQI